ncbi:hypothetical protein ET495_11620 [Xylanimonas allomyrinae]|uniref:D-alanyl-D-alanine carboxypeptidase-like core domain-containing protein n=1 Tax=Xylanimonas allomyrinae TaxID=2509459 RepID=A0A4P6EM68_9MICO|nr:M15 family metallopeptidase [Xylanimonas allomyrinae]QAY63782.1 hypothetical protein ET495_11620 [Xylanimonas allomyrinae]
MAAALLLATGTLASSVALPPDVPRLGLSLNVAHASEEGATSVVDVVDPEVLWSISQVLSVVDRAERSGRAAGVTITPAAQQSASELGVLLATYLDQHAADLDALPTPADPSGLTSTLLSSAARADATEPGGDEAEVTFEVLFAAALRLADMLDPSRAYEGTVVEVSGDDAAGDGSLAASLREVVSRYGNSTSGYSNGRIPADVLCPLPFAPGQRLRCDAAAQLVALDAAFAEQFGAHLAVTDSYRSIESQIRLRQTKPALAATPGYSNHGWGLAVDLGAPVSSGLGDEYRWLRLHGPDYGWDNPSWARLDGSKPEPWHFEFFAAGPVPNRALSEDEIAALNGTQGTTKGGTKGRPGAKAPAPGSTNGTTTTGLASDTGTSPVGQAPAGTPDAPATGSEPPAATDSGLPGTASPTPSPAPSPTPSPASPSPSPSPSPSAAPRTPSPSAPTPASPTPASPTPASPTPASPTPAPSPGKTEPAPAPPSPPATSAPSATPRPPATSEPAPSPSPSAPGKEPSPAATSVPAPVPSPGGQRPDDVPAAGIAGALAALPAGPAQVTSTGRRRRACR